MLHFRDSYKDITCVVPLGESSQEIDLENRGKRMSGEILLQNTSLHQTALTGAKTSQQARHKPQRKKKANKQGVA
jgi:hypothetical protein